MSGIADYYTVELTCTKCGKKVPRLVRNLDHEAGKFLCPECVKQAELDIRKAKVFTIQPEQKLVGDLPPDD